jgi:hypothetical protein
MKKKHIFIVEAADLAAAFASCDRLQFCNYPYICAHIGQYKHLFSFIKKKKNAYPWLTFSNSHFSVIISSHALCKASACHFFEHILSRHVLDLLGLVVHIDTTK